MGGRLGKRPRVDKLDFSAAGATWSRTDFNALHKEEVACRGFHQHDTSDQSSSNNDSSSDGEIDARTELTGIDSRLGNEQRLLLSLLLLL